MAVSQALAFYIGEPNDSSSLAFVYSVVCSVLAGVCLVKVRIRMHEDFMEECLGGKVKRQHVERFILGLVSGTFHEPSLKARVNYRVFSRILDNFSDLIKRSESLKLSHDNLSGGIDDPSN